MKKSLSSLLVLAAVIGMALVCAAFAHATGVQPATLDPSVFASPEASTLGLAGAAAFGTIKYKARGVVMDYANASGATILSGAVVVIGTKIGVALADIANGATGSVQLAGVFELTKLGTDVVAQGAALYWDAGNSRLTTTAGGNTAAGYAWTAAGNGVTVVQLLVNGCPCS